MNDKPALGAELFAEFLGTLVLILFGTGVVAMVVLFPTNNAGELIHGGYTNITIGWGRDYVDVSPINGFIVGGGAHQVAVAVDVNPA